ncbi:MAG: hypothetical protein JZU52_05970 [Lamprocystis purpurea]|jgi:hypothetical protein|uniref:hypothetical protein n=1 Tax=Lamprocystis purpurea TaxID=61598 RepID=UPI0012F9DC70|nr:hypothetical protein [Lamprocystis purpurea]MBV5273192.1 hypothetical protein [Lamprocystis purpurea]
MIYSIKVLRDGDQVLNVWGDKVAILRSNGEVDIYSLILEKDCLPRLSGDIWRITYGNEKIEITNGGVTSEDAAKDDDDDDDFVISIKSPKNKG